MAMLPGSPLQAPDQECGDEREESGHSRASVHSADSPNPGHLMGREGEGTMPGGGGMSACSKGQGGHANRWRPHGSCGPAAVILDKHSMGAGNAWAKARGWQEQALHVWECQSPGETRVPRPGQQVPGIQ